LLSSLAAASWTPTPTTPAPCYSYTDQHIIIIKTSVILMWK
jgi:hypothetical protein